MMAKKVKKKKALWVECKFPEHWFCDVCWVEAAGKVSDIPKDRVMYHHGEYCLCEDHFDRKNKSSLEYFNKSTAIAPAGAIERNSG